jgi:hypothetical protein
VVASHHIVFDRWSASIFARELAAAYEAYSAGAAPTWDELPVQYADYAEWQRERLDGGLLDAQVAYWREALAGVAPLELPIDRLRPAQSSHRGGEVAFAFDATTTAKLQALARRHEASLFMVLLAAFEAFVHRWSGQADIAVAVPVAGRPRPELEGMIGYFANVVVMRGNAADDPTFDAFSPRCAPTPSPRSTTPTCRSRSWSSAWRRDATPAAIRSRRCRSGCATRHRPRSIFQASPSSPSIGRIPPRPGSTSR